MEKVIVKFRGKSKRWGTNSRRPLIESNNNIPEGNDLSGICCSNPVAQNDFNTHEEAQLQSEDGIKHQGLAEVLRVDPDGDTSEDGSHYSMPNSGQQDLNQSSVRLIQRSVSQHFPKPQANLSHQQLQQHLSQVQKNVLNELLRLGPLLQSLQLMGCLVDCYHRQTLDHLGHLIQNTGSCKVSFLLMDWVLHTYLSQDLLLHPDLQDADLLKTVDLLLLTELLGKAKDKLLENVQMEVRGYLENILQTERSQDGCNSEEAFVQLHVDTIECIDAMPEAAQKISSQLSVEVREVCFQELLIFLRRYTAEQAEILGQKANMDKPEMTHFTKTLNTCKQLRQHVQTKGGSIKRSLLQETVAVLENMEAFTLKLLLETVADIAEKRLKNYFKSENKEFFLLIQEVKTNFPNISCWQDTHKTVMNDVYKLIAHLYLKHLIRHRQSKLRKCWSPDVGNIVTLDAQLLHNIISDLAPGVQQANLMLLKVAELLKVTCIEATKLTVATMEKDCPTWSKDLDLLPALLQWKGLPRWRVREVLDAIPGHQPRSTSWYCLTCW